MTENVLPFPTEKPRQPAALPYEASATPQMQTFLWTVLPELVAEFAPTVMAAPPIRFTAAEHLAEARHCIAQELARHAPAMSNTATLTEALLATGNVRAVLAGFGADSNTLLVCALERQLAPEWR